MRHTAATTAAILVALASCGDASSVAEAVGITTVEPGSTGEDSNASTFNTVTTATPTTASSGGTAMSVDLGSDTWDVPEACGALDVLFVLERAPTTSSQMYWAAPELVPALAELLPGWSLRFMYVLGQTGPIPLQCEEACELTADCEPTVSLECDQLTACDWTRGAGLVWRSPNTRCLPDDQRWIEGTDPDFVEFTRCVWDATGGSGTRETMNSLLGAVSPAMQGSDGCNEGFLREDAWLLPILASFGSPKAEGTPAEWADVLSASKGGERGLIVPVAILDPMLSLDDPPYCEEGPGDETKGFETFVNNFEGGVVGSLCEDFMIPIELAAGRIAEVCKVGEPPE